MVADVVLEEDKIAQATITGDFFLEPETALADMVEGLVGAPADSSVEDLTRRMDRHLPEGAALIGFSTQSVATAVKRAIDEDKPRERA